jgi:hypothetical protein
MELKAQALERVLEALSPALAAELDRVAAETREALEQEFQARFRTAVLETEAAAKASAEAQITCVIAETKETTEKEVAAELEERFRSRLAEITAHLNAEASAERAQLQAQVDQWRVFAEMQQQLGEASSQPEILARFLKTAQSFAAGLGLYIIKSGGLALWKHHGNGAFPEIISQQTTIPDTYFRPILVRGKVVGAVCAMPPFSSGALDFLSSSLERAIEIFGLKLKTPVPRPAVASETPKAVWRPASTEVESPAAASSTGLPDSDNQRAHSDARGIHDLSPMGKAYRGPVTS